MNPKAFLWISHGSTLFSALFFVFCVLSTIESMSSVKVMKLGISSIAPENLKRAPESFRLNLRAESHDFPVDEMTKTKAWGSLQNKLSGYAERLALIEKQNRQRRLWISILCLVSALGMATCSLLNLKLIKSTPKKGPSSLASIDQ